MALPGNDEQIVIQIILDTKQANAAMKELTGNFSTIFKDVGISSANLQKSIEGIARVSGRSFKDIGNDLKQMYSTQVDNANVSKQLGQNLKSAFNTQVNQSVQRLESGLKGATTQGQGFNQVLRLIRGTLVAIGVFRVIQFIEDSLRKANEAAEDFETTLYRIRNAERLLSEQGIDITTKDLLDAIKELKAELPIFSETDLSKQVSLIGIMTRDLGLGKDEIYELARAIGILNINSADTEDLMTTTNKVLQAIVSKGPGVGSLGVKFSEAAVRAKAVEIGLLGADQSLSDLSDTQRDYVVGLAKVAITTDYANKQVDTLNEYMKTNAGRIQTAEEGWEDLLKNIGQLLLPFRAAVSDAFIGFSEVALAAISQIKSVVISSFSVINAVIYRTGQLLQGNFKDAFAPLEKDVNRFRAVFEEMFAPERVVENLDTATESAEGLGDALTDITEIEGFDKLTDDLEKLQKKLDDAAEDFKREWGDINIDLDAAISLDTASDEFANLAREVQDYVIDIQRLIQDYAIKRQRIIDDSNQKIADANKKARNRELDDEARFQEQLRQLREKFLFNLEDALRERDARQVLRLQRQYQMDKTALENENALRQQEADRQHQEDLDRIRQERDDRLEELRQEEQLRLQREREDFELRQQRAEEDHQRELDQINQQISDRLELFAEQIGKEYDLNADAVDQLKSLLSEYYGPGGEFDKLYDYSYDSLVAHAQRALDLINQLRAQTQLSLTPLYPSYNPQAIQSIGPQADGGTYFANRPTSAVFGEAGPEIASFIPLRKLGQAGAGGGLSAGGRDGTVNIELWLSPDLEARIMNNTLNETANVFTRVNRTKQR